MNMEVLTVEVDFLKEAHKAACSDWKAKLEDKFPILRKPQLVEGQWYKHVRNSDTFCCFVGKDNYQSGNGRGYGFWRGSWRGFDNETIAGLWAINDSPSWEPYYGNEHKKLIALELENRGVTMGVSYYDQDTALSSDTFLCEVKGELKLTEKSDLLTDGYGGFVYHKGRIASPVTATMTIAEAEEKFGIKIKK